MRCFSVIKFHTAWMWMAAAVFSMPAGALVKNLTGEIDGTVRDSSDGGVPKATVTVRNTDQNTVVRTVQTDDQGQFTAQILVGSTRMRSRKYRLDSIARATRELVLSRARATQTGI